METPHWISVRERLPEENVQVLCCLKYDTLDFSHMALMYRQDNEWYFVGSNTSMRSGKFIKYWLEGLTNPVNENNKTLN